MKILVAVKRVVDYNVKIRVKSDNSGVDTANVKMSMNPFDEIAVEEAVRLKEKNIASEVVLVSIGNDKCSEIIRSGLAIGADRGIHVILNSETEPLIISKILASIFKKESPDIIILGKQAIDDDCNQTGQMLAALLDLPQATFASKLEVNKDKKSALVTREVDGGLETLEVTLPAIITTDLRLNEPRYAKLPEIMKARTKPLATIKAEDLGIDLKPRIQIVKVEEPAKRSGGEKVKTVEELVEKLKKRGVL